MEKAKTEEKQNLPDIDTCLYFMSENLNHARHIENERHTFLSIYLVVIGFFLGNVLSGDIAPVTSLILCVILLCFSDIMLKLLKRWREVYDGHMAIAKELNLVIRSRFGDDASMPGTKYKPTESHKNMNDLYYFDNRNEIVMKGSYDKKKYISTNSLFFKFASILRCVLLLALIISLLRLLGENTYLMQNEYFSLLVNFLSKLGVIN